MRDQELFDRSDTEFIRATRCPIARSDAIEKRNRIRQISLYGVAAGIVVLLLSTMNPSDGFSKDPLFLAFGIASAIFGIRADIEIKLLKSLGSKNEDPDA